MSLVLADLVNRHDVGVVQIGGRLRLLAETLHFFAGSERARQDHLESDGPIKADLSGPVDNAHAATGNLAAQLVVAEVGLVIAHWWRGKREQIGIAGDLEGWALPRLAQRPG